MWVDVSLDGVHMNNNHLNVQCIYFEFSPVNIFQYSLFRAKR